MAIRDTNTEAEQLRTQVEELGNALERILDALRDDGLNEAERIERAVAIATYAKTISPRQPSHHVALRG